MGFLDKMERKYGKYAIKDLMKYIVFINLGVYLLMMLVPNSGIYEKLVFTPQLVMQGEIWRIITFIFVPPNTSIIFIVFVLYFYYVIGSSLEYVWGSFKFNVYYFAGVIGTLIATTITNGIATPIYLNLSLFLAFAYFYPDNEVYIFFILPVKVKYLAYLDIFFLLIEFFKGGLTIKLLIVAAFLNCALFFGKDILKMMKRKKKAIDNKKKYQKKQVRNRDYFHRCHICGVTEKDNPKMEFRYCSECDGSYEYCSYHLKHHFHIKKGGKS